MQLAFNTKPDDTHVFTNLISSERIASPVFVALWLGLPVRERTNFIRFGPKHLIFV